MSRRPLAGVALANATLAVAALAVVVLASGAAGAQVLVDPTRPPNTVAGAAPEATPGSAQLQSILIASNRKLAIINGATVALGGMVGEAKVVKITATEVTLQKGDEREVLRLYPGVDKQPVKRSARTARGGASPQSRQGRSK